MKADTSVAVASVVRRRRSNGTDTTKFKVSGTDKVENMGFQG